MHRINSLNSLFISYLSCSMKICPPGVVDDASGMG